MSSIIVTTESHFLASGEGERETINGFDARTEAMLRVLPDNEHEILATDGLVKTNRELVAVGHEILDIIFSNQAE